MVMSPLKKSGMDPTEIQNYKLISNLPFMSKIIEKLVLSQLIRYLTTNGSIPKFQSADIIPQRQPYSEFSPTSTLPSIKFRFPSLPSSMSVRCLILWTTKSFSRVSPLQMDSYAWLESNITGREHIIHVGNHHSPPSKVLYGVPQGSVL